MASKRSKKSNFISSYGEPGETLYISGGQVIAERVMAFRHKNLPPKFWMLDEYKDDFVLEVIWAGKLLKKYDIKVLLDTVNQCKLRSLAMLISKQTNFAKKNLAEQNKNFNKTVINDVSEVHNVDIYEKPIIQKSKGVLGKIKGLEGGKKESCGD